MGTQEYLLAAQIAVTAGLFLATIVLTSAALFLRAAIKHHATSSEVLKSHGSQLVNLHFEMMDTLAAAANIDVARFRAAQKLRESQRSMPDPSTIKIELTDDDKASA